jgi:predicted O-methyltransferase YrrM
VKLLVRSVIPLPLLRLLIKWRQERALKRTARVSPVSSSVLRKIEPLELEGFFKSSQYGSEWPEVSREISTFSIVDGISGVNPGDRQAIYYFIRGISATNVLEIGTNIGASTAHIIAALIRNGSESGTSISLTTIDIQDVNDAVNGFWKTAGCKYPPREIARKMGVADQVNFVTGNSLNYFSSNQALYDVIFLDGDHAAKTVYQEIPAALSHVRPGGVILMHDFFPNGEPIWPKRRTTIGPWLAVQRLQAEGGDFKVLPFGELPWKTKQGSNRTSLAAITSGQEHGNRAPLTPTHVFSGA